MSTDSKLFEDAEDRRTFVRRAGVAALCGGGLLIAAPSYMSIVNGKRQKLANELLAKVVPSVSEKQQSERERLPSDASTHIDELFQSLSFNTAEFAHDLRSHETVKFLYSFSQCARQ